jgi:MATE family multidrug resistance protein
VAIGVSVAFALVAAIVVFFSRSFIAELYSSELPVVLLAVDLLLFVVLFQFFDDAQVTAVGALRGFKDTRTPMWMAIVSYWFVGLPVGVCLGYGWVDLPMLAGLVGLRGFWVGLLSGLGVAAVLLLTRFSWLSRQEARVLEYSSR